MAIVRHEMLRSIMNSRSDICLVAPNSTIDRDTHEVIRRLFHRIRSYLLCYSARGKV